MYTIKDRGCERFSRLLVEVATFFKSLGRLVFEFGMIMHVTRLELLPTDSDVKS